MRTYTDYSPVFHRSPLHDACTNCGAELADVLTTQARFDQWGNAYCGRKCQAEAVQLLAHDDAQPLAEAA